MATNEIKSVLLNYRYNTKAFITPPWKEIYKTDTERHQTFADAIEAYERPEPWYEDHGYAVIVLPKDSINSRVKFIVSQISN